MVFNKNFWSSTRIVIMALFPSGSSQAASPPTVQPSASNEEGPQHGASGEIVAWSIRRESGRYSSRATIAS